MAGLAAVPLIESLEMEEEIEAAEDPGLIIRPRRGRAEQNGLEEVEDHERRSVYLDSAEGIWKCRHCTWTYLMENSAIDYVQQHEEVLHKGVNLKTISQPRSYFPSRIKGVGSPKGTETEESEPIADVKRKQEYHPDNEKKLGFANGFHIGGNHKITEKAERQEYNSESEKKLEFEKGFPIAEVHTITKKGENLAGPESIKRQRADPSQSEVKSDVPIREINDIKEEVAEYDVEKVLEDQETHDLYCPNCHSCITKRVILRKRKRIGKPLEGESQRPKRQIVGPNVGSDPVNPSTPDPTQEPEVFRCLSCFSFFIPTASGFKLFRIFGRKEEDANLQSPRQIPAQDLNSVGLTSPLLTTEYADSGSQLQRDPQLSNGEQSSNDVLASSNNLETVLNSQGNVEIAQKVESSIKQNVRKNESPRREVRSSSNGFQFFRIFGWRDDDQSLKTSQEDTVPQMNSDRTTPDDVGIGKSPAEESEVGPTTHSDISIARVKVPLEGSEEMPLVPSYHLSEETKTGVESSLQEEKKVLIPSKPDYSLSLADAKANDVKQVDAVRQLPSQSVQVVPTPASPGLLIDEEAGLNVGQQIVERSPRQLDILKSIVYGGLIESLTSLGVVSAAAGSNATTLNIVVMALANLVGGLIVLAHNLRELITDQRTTDQRTEDEDRYYRALGRRVNFRLHVVVAIISYIIFGMIPPITYGFSFRKSDDKDYKLMAVAGASFFCILLLATGKAHIQQSPKPYIKKIMYYLTIGLMSSGLSYVVGELLSRAMEKTGLFDSSAGVFTPSSSSTLIETWPAKTGWESY